MRISVVLVAFCFLTALLISRTALAAHIIRYDGGGDAFDYFARGLLFNLRGETLVIDGICVSACTVLADHARPRTCVTKRAQLFFHEGRLGGQVTPIEALYAPDILAWIKRRGGLPANTFLRMRYAKARRFFRRCGPRDLQRR